MDLLKHINTVEEILMAVGAAMVAVAVVVRLLQRLAKVTPTPKDDEALGKVADALEESAEDVRNVKLK